jgi:integrase
MAKKKQTGFSYSAGEWGRNRVRLYEDAKSGRLFLEWRANGKRQSICLPHTDLDKAKQQADETAAKFSTLTKPEKPTKERLTLASLFDMYLRDKTPDKGERKQHHDKACADMFLRFFGSDREPRTLARQDWDRFIRERRDGRIAPNLRKSNRGKRPKGKTLRKVGGRAIEYDLKFILAVLNWAMVAGDGHGNVLLDRNPFKGFPVLKEKSPTRAILTQDEYETLLTGARALGWRYELMLVLAHETGHRVGAIRQLRWSDVDVKECRINWPQHSDKIGMAHTTPLTPAAFAVLEKARSECESITWLFPSPTDPGQSCTRDYVAKWWRAIADKGGLSHRKGLGFHSLRRKFATDLKDVPYRDLLELGGWRNLQTLVRCYQAAPTPQRQLDILLSRSQKAS